MESSSKKKKRDALSLMGYVSLAYEWTSLHIASFEKMIFYFYSLLISTQFNAVVSSVFVGINFPRVNDNYSFKFKVT